MNALKVVLREEERPSCPYCRERIALDEKAVTCERCGTVHHEECARELSRCTVLGCGGALGAGRPRRRPLPPAVVRPGDSGTSWWEVVGFVFWGALEILNVLLIFV